MKKLIKDSAKSITYNITNIHKTKKALNEMSDKQRKEAERQSLRNLNSLVNSIVEIIQKRGDEKTKLIFLSPRGSCINPGWGKTFIERLVKLNFNNHTSQFTKNSYVRISETTLNEETFRKSTKSDSWKKFPSKQNISLKEFIVLSRKLKFIIPEIKVRFSNLGMFTIEENPVPMVDVSFTF